MVQQHRGPKEEILCGQYSEWYDHPVIHTSSESTECDITEGLPEENKVKLTWRRMITKQNNPQTVAGIFLLQLLLVGELMIQGWHMHDEIMIQQRS
jgi:hypothetical protein